MNCTKCGKEIEDSESKICEECKRNLLTNLQSEPEETKESSKKIKVKKEKSKSNNKLKKMLIILFITIVLICTIVGINYKTDFITKYIIGNNVVGINVGNNSNNFGYANIQKGWIYYMSLSEDSMEISINKIKTNGTKKTVLAQKDWEVYSINVVGNYIYFVAFEPVAETEETTSEYKNNKIYRMTTDGKELTVINDNDFSDDCISIYVIKDKVYYIGSDYNIYSMDTNGEKKTKINDNETGYIGVTDKYILFNDYPENPQSETDYITYIMDLDGSNIRAVNGNRLYNANIVGNYIYYVNEDNNEIRRINMDGTNDIKIYSTRAYNMNVYGDYIYYLDYKTANTENADEPICIHRVKKDGTEHEVIVEMENYSYFINIVGNWIYYTDHNDNSYYINLLKTDGTDKINLYTYNYEG